MTTIYVITDSGLLVSVADLSCASVAAAMNGPGPAAQLGVSPGYLGVLSCPHDPVVVGDVLTSPGLGSTNVLAFGQPYVAGSSSSGASSCTTALSPDCFSSAGITPADIAYVYAWGVAAILTLFALGFAVSAAVKAVRLA